jgi:hypothetical protein
MIPVGYASAATPPPVPVEIQHVVKTQPQNDALSIATSAAQVAIAVAAIVGLPAIAIQVRAARRNAISERTAVLQTQWGSREFLGELGPVIAYLVTPAARQG